MRDLGFLAVEIEQTSFVPLDLTEGLAWASAPWGLPARTLLPLEASSTLLASDVGYRTRAADPGGVRPYPPVLLPGLTLDQHVPLDPAQSAVTQTLGSLQLANPDRLWDGLIDVANVDGRVARILQGTRAWDAARGIAVDPPYASLAPLWTGVCRPWTLAEAALTVPVEDNTYRLARSMGGDTYAGTGGAAGSAAIAGQPIRMVRGGSPSDPARSCPVTLIDPVRLIFQYTDGPGTVVTLYEGGGAGAGGIAPTGDVADLWSGAIAPGSYRTCNALGMFQVGRQPQKTLTVDCTGAFRGAGAVSSLAEVVRAVLLEELALPAGLLDAASFAAADAACPFPVGIALDGSAVSGASVLTALLGGTNLRIVPMADGTLGLQRLRAPDPGEDVVASWTAAEIVDVAPVSLGAPLDPPAKRWQVGWGRFYVTQTSDFSALADAARQQALAQEWRTAVAVQREVQLKYRQPSDPALLATALLRQADAQACADAQVALWTPGRRAYDLTLPAAIGAAAPLFGQVLATYPLAGLAGGALARVVGKQLRPSADSIVVTVIV